MSPNQIRENRSSHGDVVSTWNEVLVTQGLEAICVGFVNVNFDVMQYYQIFLYCFLHLLINLWTERFHYTDCFELLSYSMKLLESQIVSPTFCSSNESVIWEMVCGEPFLKNRFEFQGNWPKKINLSADILKNLETFFYNQQLNGDNFAIT